MLDWPTTLTQVILPFQGQCPTISPQLLCCCVTLPPISCMPMKLVHMFDHQMCGAFHLMLTLDPQNLSKVLKKTKFAFPGFCLRHDRTVENPKCIEDHKLISIGLSFVARSVPFCGGSNQCILSIRRLENRFARGIDMIVQTECRSF